MLSLSLYRIYKQGKRGITTKFCHGRAQETLATASYFLFITEILISATPILYIHTINMAQWEKNVRVLSEWQPGLAFA